MQHGVGGQLYPVAMLSSLVEQHCDNASTYEGAAAMASASARPAAATSLVSIQTNWYFTNEDESDPLEGPYSLQELSTWYEESHVDDSDLARHGMDGTLLSVATLPSLAIEARAGSRGWFYADAGDAEERHGPFAQSQLRQWFEEEHFALDKRMQHGHDGELLLMSDVFSVTGFAEAEGSGEGEDGDEVHGSSDDEAAPWRQRPTALPRAIKPLSQIRTIYMQVLAEKPIALRTSPLYDAETLGVCVAPGDVFAAVEKLCDSATTWYKLVGDWGEGWVFDRLVGVGAKPLLQEVHPSSILNIIPVNPHVRDEIIHCFRAVAAMVNDNDLEDEEDEEERGGGAGAPLDYEWWTKYAIRLNQKVEHPWRGEGIVVAIDTEGDGRVHVAYDGGEEDVHRYHETSWARKIASASIGIETMEHVMPSSWTRADVEGFVAQYGVTPGHEVNLAHFSRLHDELRAKWRFEDAWTQFRAIDVTGDGKLQRDEVQGLVPRGASEAEITDWMARFDKQERGYITFAEFPALDRALRLDAAWLAISTSFVLCTYFVYSRVTKAVLGVFSVEKIGADSYLKHEMGTAAYSHNHIVVMSFGGIFLVLFSLLTPLVALWMLYHTRDMVTERRVATIAGFLTDGYRHEVAWFWEFLVLIRKLIILSVSLFLPEPFLQSFTAIIILIISICLQLRLRPFALETLNSLELGALFTLLSTQLSGVLLWYIRQPAMVQYLWWTERISIVILFLSYGLVIAGFVVVLGLEWVKDKSRAIALFAPHIFVPAFLWLKRAEEWWFRELGSTHEDMLVQEARAESRAAAWKFYTLFEEEDGFDQGAGASFRRKLVVLGKTCRRARMLRACPALEDIFAPQMSEAAEEGDSDASLSPRSRSPRSRSPRSRIRSVDGAVAEGFVKPSKLATRGRSESFGLGAFPHRRSIGVVGANPMRSQKKNRRVSSSSSSAQASGTAPVNTVNPLKRMRQQRRRSSLARVEWGVAPAGVAVREGAKGSRGSAAAAAAAAAAGVVGVEGGTHPTRRKVSERRRRSSAVWHGAGERGVL